MINLFIDDKREVPSGFNCCRNYESAISMMSVIKSFECISLDYDLCEEKNGIDVLKWMAENKIFPEQLNIHSTHETGSLIMLEYAEKHFSQKTNITRNSQ